MLKKAMKTNEFFVLIALIVLCLIIGIANPVFFSTGNIVSLMKNSIVMGIMSFALMPGIIEISAVLQIGCGIRIHFIEEISRIGVVCIC